MKTVANPVSPFSLLLLPLASLVSNNDELLAFTSTSLPTSSDR